uniref:RRM domain-containing protein n=1 Tax=Panagrellus redivivus TaxID=6233 RepID=A0A7E5A1F6_PANRE
MSADDSTVRSESFENLKINPAESSSTETAATPATVLKQEPVEPDYVLVKDVATDEIMELPTQIEDNTLGLKTLTHAFPGAHGLKYKTAVGTTRALLADSTGSKFYAPATGWAGKTFTVIFSGVQAVPPPPPAPIEAKPRISKSMSGVGNGDQNAKRKKMMDDNDSSDSDGGEHRASGDRSGHHQVTAKQKRLEPAEPVVKEEPPVVPAAVATTPPTTVVATADDKDDSEHPTDLIVLGIPFKLTESNLREYFETFGKVVLCEIKRESNGSSKGFGFIKFETFESQLKVLARAVHTIGGRRCQVKVPFSKKSDGRDEHTVMEHIKLFVGRLSEKTSETALREFFLAEAKKIDPKASVIDTFIPKPFRSFAFITFSSAKVVKELIRKGDFIIDGSSVSVSSAAPKAPETSHYNNYSPEYPNRNTHSHYPEFTQTRRNPWNRNGSSSVHQPPTNRFNEQAFLRPYGMSSEQPRKRTFMETSYASMPDYPSPFSNGPSTTGSVGGGQALASGFETLNLNQLPSSNHDMLSAFSQFMSSQKARNTSIPPSGPSSMSQQSLMNGLPRGMPRYSDMPQGPPHPSQQMPYGHDDRYFGGGL